MAVCRSSVEQTLLPSLRFCPWSIFCFAMLKPPMRQQDQLMASKAKEKLWQEALGIFQEVKASARPDIVMYTTALTACRKAAKWQAALAILQEAQEEAEVNVTTFTAALSCCGKAAQWKQALHVLGCMQKWQLQPNVVTMGAAIDACGKSQQWQRVAALFAELSERSFQPNAVVLSAGISAVEKAGCWQLALRLLRTADARGANVWAYNAAISACGQSARWQDALLLMREAAEAAVRVDTITASAASGACEKASAWHAALQLLHVLPHASVDANVVTYSSAVSACEKQSRWRFASCLLALAQGARLGDVILHGASVSSCQKSNEWRWAVQGLARLPQLGLVPDLVVQNAGISACDDWRRSLALMPRTSARSRRNLVTYSSALTGKVHWRHSLQLLAELRSRGLEAAPIVYTSIMNSLSNRWQHAVYLTTATELDTVAYNAATNVCRLAAQWLQALFLARRLQDQRLQPSLLVFGWAFSASATTDWRLGENQRRLDKVIRNAKVDSVIPLDWLSSRIETGSSLSARFRQSSSIIIQSSPVAMASWCMLCASALADAGFWCDRGHAMHKWCYDRVGCPACAVEASRSEYLRAWPGAVLLVAFGFRRLYTSEEEDPARLAVTMGEDLGRTGIFRILECQLRRPFLPNPQPSWSDTAVFA
ncbi:unnamed protein product [Effrenium voratum]|uniref:Pentatricopeptide repeat-containing protein, chloroplastic n=1 Tax=Effrenium voratum TaxID=2562239 RepID=A0AA36JTU5_9DINO|nr:unnamed protein product [Effrenium voratum]